MKYNQHNKRGLFLRDDFGGISILFAILLPLIVGFLAMASDTGIWYIKQRNMQAATDLAALSAARDIGTLDYYVIEANVKSEASRNGFSELDGVTFTVNNPPLSGTYMGNVMALEVELSQPQDRFFSVLHTDGDPTANARAVGLKSVSGEACVLALNASASSAISFQGNPSVVLDGCLIASNSNHSCAITVGGSAELEAESLYTVGEYCTTGGAYTLNLAETPVTKAASVNDPYADLPEPNPGGCDKTNYTVSANETLSPGVYCSGLTINANKNVTLASGIYYINRGDFKVNGGATVTGNGVTIILTDNSGTNVGQVDINGSASLNLTATSDASSDYDGVLFYQDRDASGGTNKINGNSSNSLKGTLYFPSEAVEFSGNSASGSSCLRLIADTVKFGGNAGMSHNCVPVGGENVTTEMNITLVE